MKLDIALFVFALAGSGLACAAPPQQPTKDTSPASGPANTSGAAPFGLPLGAATCDALKGKLGASDMKALGDGDIWVEAPSPEHLYPGATKVAGRCSDGKVIAVQVEASKGGMDAAGAREAFSALRAKYKLVSGGPMPALGDGYARFVAGASVIEQSSPHLSFEFTVTYYTKDFYDTLVANRGRDQDRAGEKKRSSL